MAKPPDRVQLLKQELATDGGDPLDGEEGYPAPVDSTEDGVQVAGFFLGESAKPAADELVGGYREDDELVLFDSLNPLGKPLSTLAGGGMTPEEHKVLRQAIHFIDDGPGEGFASGAYRETTGSPFVSSRIWYTSAAKTEKIVELTISRNANKSIASKTWKIYDTDGSTVLATITDTITRSGIFETSRSRAIA